MVWLFLTTFAVILFQEGHSQVSGQKIINFRCKNYIEYNLSSRNYEQTRKAMYETIQNRCKIHNNSGKIICKFATGIKSLGKCNPVWVWLHHSEKKLSALLCNSSWFKFGGHWNTRLHDHEWVTVHWLQFRTANNVFALTTARCSKPTLLSQKLCVPYSWKVIQYIL